MSQPDQQSSDFCPKCSAELDRLGRREEEISRAVLDLMVNDEGLPPADVYAKRMELEQERGEIEARIIDICGEY